MTKEQKYREQMQSLGIYEEMFEPELQTLCRMERDLTRALKAWSKTAVPVGSAPSFTDPHYEIIQRLRSAILQHREALGLTPKALRKLSGPIGTDAPSQRDLITAKLDTIAERVASYADPFAGIPAADDAAAISSQMDPEALPDEYDLAAVVAADMG